MSSPKFFYDILSDYWLWQEISKKLGVSNPAWKYWKSTSHLKLGKRYLFLKKNTLPQKYSFIENNLTKLEGFLPVGYASDMLNTDNHIFNYKRMALYSAFEYKFVENIKFVNIKRFFIENNIKISKNSYIQLAPLNKLYITNECTFYRLNSSYGIVVYDG